jgi:hypothetical protein
VGRSEVLSTSGYLYSPDTGTIHGYKLKQRQVMEAHLGRALTKNEVVHHIDNDRLNNTVENLWLTNGSDHTRAHVSLTKAAWEAFKQGHIKFDRETGKYFCPRKEIP